MYEGDDHSSLPFGSYHQFDINYYIIWAFDFSLMIQFIILNYHKVYWKKVSKEFYKQGYFFNDFKMKNVPFTENFWLYISNFLSVFKPCLIKGLVLMFVQPWRVFNTSAYSSTMDRKSAFDIL